MNRNIMRVTKNEFMIVNPSDKTILNTGMASIPVITDRAKPVYPVHDVGSL